MPRRFRGGDLRQRLAHRVEVADTVEAIHVVGDLHAQAPTVDQAPPFSLREPTRDPVGRVRVDQAPQALGLPRQVL